MNKQIDENLRRVYSDTANEPVPDRFAQLLEQLRKQEQATGSKENGTVK